MGNIIYTRKKFYIIPQNGKVGEQINNGINRMGSQKDLLYTKLKLHDHPRGIINILYGLIAIKKLCLNCNPMNYFLLKFRCIFLFFCLYHIFGCF